MATLEAAVINVLAGREHRAMEFQSEMQRWLSGEWGNSNTNSLVLDSGVAHIDYCSLCYKISC